MPSNYHLTEPFPAPKVQRTYTGRGGAGNITKPRPTTTFTPAANKDLYLVQSTQPYPPPSTFQSTLSKPSARKNYTSGRGGIGNLHPASERAIFSFDEELQQAYKAEQTMAPIYHIGRGGGGNIVDNRRMSGSASMRSGSTSSADSERGFRSSLEKVKHRLSRQ